ncbi:MAG: hypothetical protein GC192_10630 [Bacteroidetes bacterium]|nr:hypothetical protein [Bacteroidota bacterium]
MRKGIAISLLVILGCPLIGTKAILLQRKSVIKLDIKAKLLEGINDDELIHFAFVKQDAIDLLEWENTLEFEFNDEMFDVVRSVERGDSVFYSCLHDKDETTINHQLSALLPKAMGTDPANEKCVKGLFSFLKSLFVQVSKQHSPVAYQSCRVWHLYMPLTTTVLTTPPSPPPEV